MVDLWSMGCILAELYTGFPLFPGEDETEQLQCIMEILGVPPRDLVEKATRRKMFFDRCVRAACGRGMAVEAPTCAIGCA